MFKKLFTALKENKVAIAIEVIGIALMVTIMWV